jgi:hypothetical protein
MPVLYKPFQSNLEDKKSGKKLFYPHVVRTGNINSAQLSKEIAAYSSLSPGDVKNTLDNLVTESDAGRYRPDAGSPGRMSPQFFRSAGESPSLSCSSC